ncbi:MAG TPA: hypothetical protein VMD30_11675 [Tepidisphaeraceae bacterium]|nr:hypothetical protein [Tepidisphaeraceae bacterium]
MTATASATSWNGDLKAGQTAMRQGKYQQALKQLASSASEAAQASRAHAGKIKSDFRPRSER